MRNWRTIGGVAVVAVNLVGLAACTTHRSLPTPSASAATSHVALPHEVSPTVTPSYPGGTTACAQYLAAATTPQGTVPLLSCTGVTLTNLPVVRVKVGDQVLISGFGDRHVTLIPIPATQVSQVTGNLFVTTSSGITTLSVSGWYCPLTMAKANRQPTGCPLVRLVAT